MVEPGSATRRSTALRSFSFRARGAVSTPFARSNYRSASTLSPWRCSAVGAGGSCRNNSSCRDVRGLWGASGVPLGSPVVGAWAWSEGTSDGDSVTAAAPSLSVSIIPSYDWERRWRAERLPRCGLGASRRRPKGSASGSSGCCASHPAIAVQTSAWLQPSGRRIPFARSRATSTVPGRWHNSSVLGRLGSRTNRCQSSVLRRGGLQGPLRCWSPPHRRFPPAHRLLRRQLRVPGRAHARAFLAPFPLSLTGHFRHGKPADHPDGPSHTRRRGEGPPSPDPGRVRPLSGGHRPPASSTRCRSVHRAGWKVQWRCRSLHVEDAQASTPGFAAFVGGTCAPVADSDPAVCAWAWGGAGKRRPWTPRRRSSARSGSPVDRRQLLHRRG